MLFLMVAIILCPLFGTSQSIVWKYKKVYLDVPTNFYVLRDNSRLFAAMSAEEDIQIQVNEYVSLEVGPENLDIHARTIAEKHGIKGAPECTWLEIEGFKGCYFMSEASEERNYDQILSALIIDLSDQTKFEVVLEFNDKRTKKALKMLDTFRRSQ